MRLSHNRGGHYHLSLEKRGSRLWHDTSGAEWAILYPGPGDAIYAAWGDQGMSLVRRAITGRTLWNRVVAYEALYWPCVGGETLFFQPAGPTYGVMIEDVRNWPEILESAEVKAFDLRHRRVRWTSSMRRIGNVLWTNGSVFVDMRIDVSPRSVRQVRSGRRKLPVWLEERRVVGRRLLWRRRLTGYPPGLGAVQAVGDRAVRLQFTRSGDMPFSTGSPFFHYVGPRAFTVPVLIGPARVRPAAVVYRSPYDAKGTATVLRMP